jgi:hypothetical protein
MLSGKAEVLGYKYNSWAGSAAEVRFFSSISQSSKFCNKVAWLHSAAVESACATENH